MGYNESYDGDAALEAFKPLLRCFARDEILALEEHVPWPLDGVPFSFSDPEDLYGTFVGLRPGHRFVPEPRLVAREPVGVRVDPAEVCRRKGVPPPLQQLATWLSLKGPDGKREDGLFIPTFGWPCRLLSVLAWLVSGPEVFPARESGPPAYVDLLRVTARAGVIPGGHLDAMLQLSLRVVRDASLRLHDAIGEAGLADAVRLPSAADAHPPLIADAICGLSPVPGAPLGGWSVTREFRKGVSARRQYVWGWRPPAQRARALREEIGELLGVLGEEGNGRGPFHLAGPRRGLSDADLTLARGDTYTRICARWIGLVALASRLLLHHVYRVCLVYSDARPDGYRAHLRTGWADALRELAKLPADDFEGFAGALVERAGSPPEWPWYLERELEDVARRNGLDVLGRVWGITPDLTDSLDRAGAADPIVKQRVLS